MKPAPVMERAVRRPARGDRQHRRRRPALRGRRAQAQADPAAPAGDDEDETLRREARAGLEQRLAGTRADEAERQAYRDRLEFEIDVIIRHGLRRLLPDRRRLHQMGQGATTFRSGRAAARARARVVAWSLTITDLDPIALGLLFERFLNPERVSMPDFDIDFCETRRDEVIRYVQEQYGRDKVAQIITFGKLKARAVLKDTGRVLQMSYGQVDRLAKLVPNHPTDPWTLRAQRSTASPSLQPEYRQRRRRCSACSTWR